MYVVFSFGHVTMNGVLCGTGVFLFLSFRVLPMHGVRWVCCTKIYKINCFFALVLLLGRKLYPKKIVTTHANRTALCCEIHGLSEHGFQIRACARGFSIHAVDVLCRNKDTYLKSASLGLRDSLVGTL